MWKVLRAAFTWSGSSNLVFVRTVVIHSLPKRCLRIILCLSRQQHHSSLHEDRKIDVQITTEPERISDHRVNAVYHKRSSHLPSSSHRLPSFTPDPLLSNESSFTTYDTSPSIILLSRSPISLRGSSSNPKTDQPNPTPLISPSPILTQSHSHSQPQHNNPTPLAHAQKISCSVPTLPFLPFPSLLHTNAAYPHPHTHLPPSSQQPLPFLPPQTLSTLYGLVRKAQVA